MQLRGVDVVKIDEAARNHIGFQEFGPKLIDNSTHDYRTYRTEWGQQYVQSSLLPDRVLRARFV